LHGDYAVNNQECPTNAVAYNEAFVLSVVDRVGLRLLGPARYGVQDILLLSKQADSLEDLQLEQGWHALENDCWRWTAGRFAVRLPRHLSGAGTLRFKFAVPQALLKGTSALRLWATINDVLLPVSTYTTAGEHIYVQNVPLAALNANTFTIRFEVDKAYGPSEVDQRELGVQVAFWRYCNDTRRPVLPMSILGPSSLGAGVDVSCARGLRDER
jgi:hypothetical protein